MGGATPVIHDRAGAVELIRQRVLIADDNPQVRQELRTLLPLAGDIAIVGEAGDGQEAIRLARVLRPDVVLMDLEMPVLDGYEAARQKASQSGVDIFLVKGGSVETLVQAICERRE
jgi:DNA-binding NarL/FixJ family response regulator